MNWKLNKVARQYSSLHSLLRSHQCRREGGEEQSVSNVIFPMWKIFASLQRSPAEGFPIASDLPDKASKESAFLCNYAFTKEDTLPRLKTKLQRWEISQNLHQLFCGRSSKRLKRITRVWCCLVHI